MEAGRGMIEEAINTVREIIPYMISILPDAILPASGIYAIFTLSYTFGMFFFSLVEARLILWALHNFAHSSMGIGFAEPNDELCRNRVTYMHDNEDFMGGAGGRQFSTPSTPMYMLSVAGAYIFNTLNNQSKELEALGPAFSTRYYVSLTFMILIVLLVGSFRLLYGCESFYNVLVSSLVGLIVGSLLVVQNVRLFGDSSVNMLGIPQLRNKTASGKKLYVCPK